MPLCCSIVQQTITRPTEGSKQEVADLLALNFQQQSVCRDADANESTANNGDLKLA